MYAGKRILLSFPGFAFYGQFYFPREGVKFSSGGKKKWGLWQCDLLCGKCTQFMTDFHNAGRLDA
jgi:hypothetical protein